MPEGEAKRKRENSRNEGKSAGHLDPAVPEAVDRFRISSFISLRRSELGFCASV